MKLSPLSTIVCATFIAAAAVPAHAAASEWSHQVTEAGANTLFTTTGETGVKLACSSTLGVQAFIYLDGEEVADDRLKYLAKRRIKMRDGAVETPSTDDKSGNWAYIKATKMLVSAEPWQGRRIYNAVIKGESVNVDVDRVGAIPLTLPAMNDAFKTFAKTCSATT